MEEALNRKSRVFLFALTAACAAISTTAVADDARPQGSASRAALMTDAQLDEITAGEVTGQHVIINNGNALVDKGTDYIHCVNCVPFPTPAHVQIVNNPSQTVMHCKGIPLC